MYFSNDRERTGVIEIGLKLHRLHRFADLGTDVIMALFHWFGTTRAATN